MPGNEQIKIQKTVLNQLAKDTRLNSFQITFQAFKSDP